MLWLKSHREIPDVDHAVFIKWILLYCDENSTLMEDVKSLCSRIAKKENSIDNVRKIAEGREFHMFDMDGCYGTKESFVPVFKTSEFSINVCLDSRIAVVVGSDEKPITDDEKWGEMPVVHLAMNVLEMLNFVDKQNHTIYSEIS